MKSRGVGQRPLADRAAHPAAGCRCDGGWCVLEFSPPFSLFYFPGGVGLDVQAP